MPRVYNPTANAYDSNGNILFTTGVAFPSKPSKAQLRKQLGAQAVADAAANNIDVSSVVTVEVDGEDLSFEITESIRKDTKRKTTSAVSSQNQHTTTNRSRPTKKDKGPSKKDQAVKIYRDNCDKSRKQVIELLVEQLGMTIAGASTYYSTAKKIVEG